MKFLLLGILMATMPWPASAVCPGHSTAIIATPEGTFKLCPKEVDAQVPPQPVGPTFYKQCDVNAVWTGGSATVTVTAPVPGVPVVVGFPAATGSGGATASCTNSDGLVSLLSASAITFRAAKLPAPAPPGMNQ